MAFVLLLGIVFAIQFAYLSREASTTHGIYCLDERFTDQDLIYGPQGWIPYASKMPIIPGGNISSDQFYLMFVDLNATSNLNSTFPRVQVDYTFAGLHGTAAFHVYGYISGNGGLQWTNRVDGDGASGYYITSNPQANFELSGTQQLDFNYVYVKVANTYGVSHNDFGNNTYFLKFSKEGGGLNSLHITVDPKVPTGQVTRTDKPNGTFFVDYTGGRVQEDFILLVAVNGSIGKDFKLDLKSSVPE
jgi:hypothetical protein